MLGYRTNKSRKQSVELNGRKFTRYLDYKGVQARLYFVANDGKKPIYFHVFKWESINKKRVPAGHCIHHIDFNPLNNRIINLQLLTNVEHNSIHKKQMWVDRNKNKKSCICTVCNKKFKTSGVIGSAYCSKECWRSSGPKKKCLFCGKSFNGNRDYKEQRFCSISCGALNRFRKANHKKECGNYS